ncbi:hypothetical protein A3A68_02385 [Candidatus Saccharibacteria bacterium RIFCSPLOWO2_01_FULL_48_13]|nr:MAG: hypothetical protein A2884_00105 [Candidatus Saccharibacteria bacterium RIFCSPHIGHO2_01_FULL_48_12]OGL36072.1 MAG: hypothetical protein A3F38_00510 [Candidatus Saccharibacteria bacterium RIFCSPHIGHO2_12_FULL_48_21]OGL36769.1 MAG: hypothetical protein A3A68_02385 [Candidatus Saccharibacteria bacterium RIFCSPLOWO2_01_FULL_48_13]
MSSSRLRLILRMVLGVGIILFIFVTWQGLATLSSKSKQLVDLKLKEKTATAQISSLAVAKKEVETYRYFNGVAKTVIPDDKNQAEAVADIAMFASRSGFGIDSITFPTSTLGGGSKTTKPTESTPANPSGQSSSTSANTASPQAALSQAKAVPGVPGLYSLELTVVSEAGQQVPINRKVTYIKLLDFLKKLENNRRTAQITDVSIKPETGAAGPDLYLVFTLKINVFIKP